MKPIFLTGNPGKVRELRRWLGYELAHRDIDLDELQELDPVKVVEDKARAAYEIIKEPVLIEDVSVVFTAMGNLPGTFIKWFLQELGHEGCCRLLDAYDDRSATVQVTYCLYDGKEMHLFNSAVKGVIAPSPRGSNGFGWNSTFIPDGSQKTYAEMDDTEIVPFSFRAPAVKQLKKFLDKSKA